jgi:hypothetical protein
VIGHIPCVVHARGVCDWPCDSGARSRCRFIDIICSSTSAITIDGIEAFGNRLSHIKERFGQPDLARVLFEEPA